MLEKPETEKEGFLSKTVGVIAWIGGAILGRYTGFVFLIMLLGAFVFGWLATRKWVKPASQVFALAFAIQGGQLFTLSTSLWANPQGALIDILVLSIGLLLLLIRPGWVPVLLLSAYQSFALIANASEFSGLQFGTDAHKGLTLYLVIHVTALALMFFGMRRFLQEKKMGISENVQPT